MVVIKALLDSFSRCLGTNHTQSTGPKADVSKPTESLSARARALNPNAADHTGACTDTNLSRDKRNSQIDVPDPGSSDASLKNRSTQSLLEADSREQAQTLAEARKKASSVSTPGRSRGVLSNSSSSLSRKASLEKARTRSNKRKLDIFRNIEQPSAFSKFLGGSQGGVFPGGAMLCFANPIFDSADDEMKIRRRQNIDDVTVDEETITSTLYFDAKYEHVVEDRQPIPLYRDYSVVPNRSGDEILQIYQSGGNKLIKSIYCGQPPPPPNVANTSMVDDTSSNESENESEDDSESEDIVKSLFSEEDCDRTFDLVDTSASSCLTISSPPTCKSHNDLDVIDDILDSQISNVPGLRLLSNSSNSMTATTLTPVGSSRSTNTSLSPKPKNHKVHSDFESPQQVNANVH